MSTAAPLVAMRGMTRVWRRDFESWKDFAIASTVGTMAEPILFFVAMGYGLGRFVDEIGGEPYVAFIAPGLVASTAMYTAAFETTFGAFTRMVEQRTYEAIVMTPISVGEVVAGDIAWAATKSAFASSMIVAIMAFLGLLESTWAVGMVPLAFVIGVMFGAMGMAWTAISPTYTFFNYFFTLFIGVMFLFGGVFFPVEGLPEWAEWAAWCLPLTHAVILMRALRTGEFDPTMWQDLVWIAVFTLLVFVLAVRLIRRRLVK
ncbi:MAG: ABC transporter permease [Gemmatimonadota bacterium]